ncbi:MAG: RNA-binding transcriptional accessory protein [Oscillospiraceae bacterium]|nr:RNA-binding transcriptional accessory protein [Oscillospiraceae bacterium]
MDLIKQLAEELKIRPEQAENAVKLLDDGNTVPFIARYRKEATGSLDDQVLRELAERLEYLRGLEKRKEEVSSSIEGQEKMTPEIAAALAGARTLAEVEDIYRPYRPKRRTRASIARERGLEPLAAAILEQPVRGEPAEMAAPYADPEKGVPTPEEALQGACDIIAENMSDSAEVRRQLRELLWKTALLKSAAAVEEDSVYRMYYEYAEPISKVPGHRVLAIDRGEREGFLKVSLEADPDRCLSVLVKAFVKNMSPCGDLVRAAGADALSRLILPSLERELRAALTENAVNAAIRVFGVNLRQLLMQPPVKNAVTLGLDPAYRTGCKIAVVDGTGKVLETTVVYPTPPQNKKDEAARTLRRLIEKHGVSVISIGNGTASHESEEFVAELIRTLPQKVSYMVVSEAGASVYSASRLAAEEFPEYDVSLRSAVSIARRLQDPLAELVKIDPKAIGVGQYQHDMPKARLDETLGGVVESCVNSVGVNLNTASFPLLSRVAGIGPAVAKNIVSYREENGRFGSRRELLKVPKLGPKAFLQCAGFIRVPESKNPLDNTAVHPESYSAAQALLTACGCTAAEVSSGGLSALREKAEALGLESLARQTGVGVPTLRDIISELQKPGRDPRDELPAPLLRTDVLSLSDLREGMELTGTVRNVIDFGAFVDIGVHEDGLVHISQLCDRFVRHPSEVVKVGDIVTVWVLGVDEKKKRISLTMRRPRSAGREG